MEGAFLAFVAGEKIHPGTTSSEPTGKADCLGVKNLCLWGDKGKVHLLSPRV